MPTPALYTIQPAGLRDINDLRLLEQESFGEESWSLFDLLLALSLPGMVRLKAVIKGQMAGFVGGEVRGTEHTGWITTIAVGHAWRHNGIGSALLDAAETQLKQPRLKLCVRHDNLEAISLYQKRGYSQVDVWPHYYVSGHDALVLEKVNPNSTKA